MSAGTAYSKRYVGGFVDKPTLTTPIDSAFLNAVETALLQLIGVAPSADGQVMQWDNANTRFGPALILNKNVDAAAAIAKSKLDFTGANGIVNADVAGAAAIARSKLDFGAGLVNADISAAAAIADSKIAGIVTQNQVVISAANTDLAWAWGSARSVLLYANTGGGTLRSIGAPTTGAGTRILLRNGTANLITLKHQLAGGSGSQLYLLSGADESLPLNCVVELVYDGSNWLNASMGNAGSPRIEAGSGIFANGNTTVTFTRPFAAVPIVVVSQDNNSGAAQVASVGTRTATNFVITQGSGGNLVLNWIAVGT